MLSDDKLTKSEMKKVWEKLQLPKRIDGFHEEGYDGGYLIEYDGWHFEAKSIKATINQVLKYIFKGGPE